VIDLDRLFTRSIACFTLAVEVPRGGQFVIGGSSVKRPRRFQFGRVGPGLFWLIR